MEDSLFAALPAELRDTIYAYILYFPEGITINIGGSQPSLRSPESSRNPLALTTVCKQIREESSTVFYAINVFRLRPHSGDPRNSENLDSWLKQIGHGNRVAIKHVDVDLGIWSPGYIRPSSATRFATPLPVQAAQYINRFRDINVSCTFSMDVRFSDIPGVGVFHLSAVDLAKEEATFGTDASVFEQACLHQAHIIDRASSESMLESYAVIRLMMGLDRCRSSFAEFLDAIRDRVARRAEST